MHRPPLSALSRFVLPLALAGIAVVVPAQASRTRASAAAPVPARRAMIAPLAGSGPRTPAQAATAAQTCAGYAARAGWLNNGYYGGDLVTAAAICVAESAGDPKLYVCDENGVAVGHGDYVQGQPVTCPAGTTSYDRGLWQLNSVAAASSTDTCAFNPACNAGQAYLYSGRGKNFSLWSSYGQDIYPKYLDAVQAVVTKLSSGTVTSALLGECLVQTRSAVGAKVAIANCGGGTTSQQWSVGGGKLRSGSVCAAITSATASSPGVVLRRCARQKTQQWVVSGRDELRNVADGKCLTDPKSSLIAGAAVDVTRCADAKDQTWWLP